MKDRETMRTERVIVLEKRLDILRESVVFEVLCCMRATFSIAWEHAGSFQRGENTAINL